MDMDTTHGSLQMLVDPVKYSSRGEKSTDKVKKSMGGMGQLYQKRGRGATERDELNAWGLLNNYLQML